MVSSDRDRVGERLSGKAGARSDTFMDDIVDTAEWVTQSVEEKALNV